MFASIKNLMERKWKIQPDIYPKILEYYDLAYKNDFPTQISRIHKNNIIYKCRKTHQVKVMM